MKLSSSDIVRFQDLCQMHLGKDIGDSVAYEWAICLVSLVKALEEPVDSDRDIAFMEEFRPSPISRRTRETIRSPQQPHGGDMPKETAWRA